MEGLDYFDTFAPTCKPETFRILLQLSAKQGRVIHQFDIKTAFLHSPIEEEVYLEQPQEFVKQWSDGKKLVCGLNKSINGLKQQLTTGIKNWQSSYWDRAHQKQEWPLLVRRSRDRGSHLHIGLGWQHHSGIKLHDSDLRCQKGTRNKILHERQSMYRLDSGSNNQTRRGQSHSRPRTLHKKNAWAVSNGSIQTLKTPADLNLKLQTAQNGDEEVDHWIYRGLVE